MKNRLLCSDDPRSRRAALRRAGLSIVLWAPLCGRAASKRTVAASSPQGDSPASEPSTEPVKDAPKAPDKREGGDGRVAKDKPATLTVLVLGDDKPVVGADVKLKSNAGSEDVRLTNDAGSVTIVRAAGGVVKVRVLAEGWDSGLAEAQLTAGRVTTLTVKLKRQAGAK